MTAPGPLEYLRSLKRETASSSAAPPTPSRPIPAPPPAPPAAPASKPPVKQAAAKAAPAKATPAKAPPTKPTVKKASAKKAPPKTVSSKVQANPASTTGASGQPRRIDKLERKRREFMNLYGNRLNEFRVGYANPQPLPPELRRLFDAAADGLALDDRSRLGGLIRQATKFFEQLDAPGAPPGRR